ncbi:MAG: SsrA-binding protein SmpB [Labilithrix sp.]|nr:SsrA-binding protein SmpB [Labilithrix sp.]
MVAGRQEPIEKIVARNRAATFHYEIAERYEAGIVLRGSEVKSLREGRAHLADAYAAIERGEAWLRQMRIAPFFAARAFPHEERGARKLLLHGREIRQIERAVSREGYTLVPLVLYFRGGYVKVELGVGRGRKVHDKRAVLAERDAQREAAEAIAARLRRAR